MPIAKGNRMRVLGARVAVSLGFWFLPGGKPGGRLPRPLRREQKVEPGEGLVMAGPQARAPAGSSGADLMNLTSHARRRVTAAAITSAAIMVPAGLTPASRPASAGSCAAGGYYNDLQGAFEPGLVQGRQAAQ